MPPVQHDYDTTHPVTLFTHGRLEPGKGLDKLVSAWKQLNNTHIQLLIAGEGSLKNWLIEQGATVVPYHDGILEEIQMTENDILALYLSTIDAFGMASLEAQIAGLSTIIFDR
ncbi:MAG: glycosyltransferase [bacterium]